MIDEATRNLACERLVNVRNADTVPATSAAAPDLSLIESGPCGLRTLPHQPIHFGHDGLLDDRLLLIISRALGDFQCIPRMPKIDGCNERDSQDRRTQSCI